MKRTLALLLALVMLLGMLPMSAFADTPADTPTITFTHDADPSTLKVGDEFTVTATLANNPGFGAFQLDLNWNSSVVEFQGFAMKYSEDLDMDILDAQVDKTPNTLSDADGIMVIGKDKNNTKNGVLFKAKFKVLKEGDPAITHDADFFQLKKIIMNDDGTSSGQFEAYTVTFDMTALENLIIDHVHDYTSEVTPPTCTEGGYTTYSCTCGDSYTGDNTPATGHTNVNGTCSVCGAALTVIPEGAPFLDMMTSDGKPVTITDLGPDPKMGMGTLYKVEVPMGTTQVDVTYNQDDVYVDNFGYAKTYVFTDDYNPIEDGYKAEIKDGKTSVGLEMVKSSANGTSGTIYLLNTPYPADPYELVYAGLGKEDFSNLHFFAFTYKMEEGQYGVSLPNSFMYTVTGDPVATGSYTFNVAMKNGYEASETFAVKVNGEVFATEPGEITVDSVTEELIITVEGVKKIYNPETDISITVDLTEYTGEVNGSLWYNDRANNTYESNLIPGKRNTVVMEASQVWSLFAYINSIGSDVVGYDINGETRDPGYLSFGFVFRDNAQPGAYVIKPIVEKVEEKEPTLFTVTANGETVTPEKGDPAECEQTGYEVNQYILILPAGTTSITLTDESGLTIYEGCNGWSAICDGETSCTLTVSEEEKYYCLCNNAEGDDYYEVHLYVVVEEGSTEPEQPVSNPIQAVKAKNPLLNKTSPEDATAPVYSVTLMSGVTEDLLLDITGENPDKDATQQLTWSSTNEAVAKVEDGKLITGTVTQPTTVTLTATVASEAAAAAIDGEGSDALITLNVTVEPANNTQFQVSMDTDKTVDVLGSTDVNVSITHTDTAQVFKAFELVFKYDPALLRLNTKGSETDTRKTSIVDDNGTVTVRSYGAANDGAALTLNFTALTIEDASVELTSAKVGTSENAKTEDIPDAQIQDSITLIDVKAFTVDLDKAFSGAEVADPSEDYTFTAKDKNYVYTVDVTVTKPDGTTDSFKITDEDKDGVLTITADKITGSIKIEVDEEKTVGKTFDVNIDGDTAAVTGAVEAQYMTDYVLTAAEGVDLTGYTIKYKIGDGEEKTMSNLTIPGSEITGDITITVTAPGTDPEDPDRPANSWKITFEGNGKDDVQVDSYYVTKDQPYTFRINKTEGYTYIVTYTGADGVVELPAAEDGTYTITPTADMTITVMKWNVEVNQYVSLNGKAVFLVSVAEAKNVGLKYDGNAMFIKSVKAQGENGEYTGAAADKYVYLVELAEGTLTVEAAARKLSIVENVTCETVGLDYNVNGSSNLDINDAQLVYDMYNNVYESIATVGMKKFLRADIGGDRIVNVQDAIAVVTAILTPQA